MWRRLLGHCQALDAGDPAERQLAVAALGNESFLDGACRQATLDGPAAAEALKASYDLLGGDAEATAPQVDRQAVRQRIAQAELGILVCLAGREEVARTDFHPWLSCLLKVRPSERATPPPSHVAGWECLDECAKDFTAVPWEDNLRVREEVKELVRRAHYDAIRPHGADEETLLGLLRRLPLFPPLRFDEIPQTGEVPDDYSTESHLPYPAGSFRELHLRPVLGLLGRAVPRVRIVAALLFGMLTPEATSPRSRSNPEAITEEERQVTLQMTNDPHPVLRRVGVERLGTLYHERADADALAAVVPHLGDPSLAVRVEAARSIAWIGPGNAVAAILDGLLPMLHEDAEPALAAALGAAVVVGASLTDRHIDRAHSLLVHPSPRVTGNAARAIEAAGPRAARPEVAESLLDLFRHAEPEVRSAAVQAYGALGLPPNERGLDEMARVLSSDPEVEVAALKAVRRLGRHVATQAVVTGLVRLLQGGGGEMALAALEGMGRAASREDVYGALGDRLRYASVHGARAVFATGRRLGPEGFTRMLRVVAEKLADPDAAVRRVAVVVLSDLKAEAATPDFLAGLPCLLQHPLAGVRESAALALEFLGPPAGTEEILLQLGQLRHDPNHDVRFRAEDALYRLTGKR